jgi:SepF-like predicted cell division protein (DUF552 family)
MVRKRLREVKESLFDKKSKTISVENEPDFIELEPDRMSERTARIFVKYFVLTDYADIKPIIDCLREGYTIAMVRISPLRHKDMLELKRAINKIKNTMDAVDGEVVGVDEEYIVAVPGFVEVIRGESEE